MKINFITTSTSGSQSIYRILTEYCQTLNVELKMYRGVECKDFKGGNDDLTIVNFRDPRDIWCNQYYWLTQHPAPNEEVTKARKARFDLGIDNSVLKNNKAFKGDSAFSLITKVYANKNSKVLFVSYAQLCLSYDSMLSNISDFLSVNLTKENNKVLYQESPEGLESNPNWIGNQWKGCDTSPGRFKDELKKETLDVLNDNLKDCLSILENAEIEELKHYYRT